MTAWGPAPTTHTEQLGAVCRAAPAAPAAPLRPRRAPRHQLATHPQLLERERQPPRRVDEGQPPRGVGQRQPSRGVGAGRTEGRAAAGDAGHKVALGEGGALLQQQPVGMAEEAEGSQRLVGVFTSGPRWAWCSESLPSLEGDDGVHLGEGHAVEGAGQDERVRAHVGVDQPAARLEWGQHHVRLHLVQAVARRSPHRRLDRLCALCVPAGGRPLQTRDVRARGARGSECGLRPGRGLHWRRNHSPRGACRGTPCGS